MKQSKGIKVELHLKFHLFTIEYLAKGLGKLSKLSVEYHPSEKLKSYFYGLMEIKNNCT